jgi:hypothetical protein
MSGEEQRVPSQFAYEALDEQGRCPACSRMVPYQLRDEQGWVVFAIHGDGRPAGPWGADLPCRLSGRAVAAAVRDLSLDVAERAVSEFLEEAEVGAAVSPRERGGAARDSAPVSRHGASSGQQLRSLERY